MVIPTVDVTVVLYGQDGEPIYQAMVSATLSKPEVYNGEVVQQHYTKISDINGGAILKLFPNALGTKNSHYDFAIYNPNTKKTINVEATIPNNNVYLHEVGVIR